MHKCAYFVDHVFAEDQKVFALEIEWTRSNQSRYAVQMIILTVKYAHFVIKGGTLVFLRVMQKIISLRNLS
jgi:hypothetical protein